MTLRFVIMPSQRKRIGYLPSEEIHEIIEENNTYKMRPVENALLIPSGGEIIFKSKSYHAMFYNFNSTLNNNDYIDATLYFNNKLTIPVKFKVIIKNNSNHEHH